MKDTDKMEKIVSLAKRRGFIYQGSEIYGGLAGTYDYGPLGVLLKDNIKALWMNKFIHGRDDMFAVDASIIMNAEVWKAVGHVDGFNDPLVEDLETKKRYRADHLLEEAGIDPTGMDIGAMNKAIIDNEVLSPDKNELGEVRQFNMMFTTKVGANDDESSVVYLRPETAQGIFTNFKNVLDTFHPRLPFGIGQIGKAFRNEIAPRDFTFRTREFEQMEIEYFVRQNEWEKHFDLWLASMWTWIDDIGLSRDKVHELDVPAEDRAHYSDKTIDFEYDFPFGKKELYGLAYRADFDLKNHAESSKQKLDYFDDQTGERFIPHVIEPTFGLDRTILAILSEAYTEDDLGGDVRVYLKFKPSIAPIKVAVFPLLKNKPELVKRAREIYDELRKEIPQITFDDNGNVGKRYRRQDEIGTPLCVTIDFETLEKEGSPITVRDRDTGEQETIEAKDVVSYIKSRLE